MLKFGDLRLNEILLVNFDLTGLGGYNPNEQTYEFIIGAGSYNPNV